MNKTRKKIADNIPYLGYAVLIIGICISFFSQKSDGKTYVYTAEGKQIDLQQVSMRQRESDSTKGKSSLDGESSFTAPTGTSSKPFDPNAPFNKVTFKQLRTYIPGQPVPDEVKNLDGTNAEILGFMTPLNSIENMDEFLLCSAPPLSCYCAPPIFINEIIYVKLKDKKTDFRTNAIKVKGQLKVNLDVKDEYSDVIYTMDAIDIE